MSGTLYVVGTPIGNLSDWSPRAVETLGAVDFIAAEDTRVTLKLLNHFEIKKEMVSYYEHNRRERGEIITSRIAAGENCAIVTDAGMPAISDPGQDLVHLCHLQGIPVVSVPGPVAFATALAVSGMESGRFTFEGFLSVNKKSRRDHLEELKDEKRTMIFYEAPHKFLNTITDLHRVFGDREIAIVRELTKVHEQVVRTTLAQAEKDYTENKIKGEIVLIVAGKKAEPTDAVTFDQAVAQARALVEKGASVNAAAKEIAAVTPYKKGDLYKALL